ncbi:xanthine dehydrogenase small subunit [Acuticoccus sp. MNP-M23]|uniref:xanthine dehydrogenase small subunit n=1 Tax=Acuticoccus sp. MNP-M23 TaxID=3072793 RepID=UPI0028152C2F|nr:xanthine dehydrogenase small subunit [Acuticoccus sp. MNP-M23]WMS44487.1 xanthine dehydrogenase small subunit [Acuticoccus sp. MNP-M23]
MEDAIRLVLNGTPVRIADAPPTLTLLEWLRGKGLTGTKEGCAEGDCGACTVAVQRAGAGGLETRALNACIMPLAMAHGASIVTVEGIASAEGNGDPHPIQREMAARHASQCGFCTPGFVMSLWARPEDAATDRQALEDRLAGNLCRCTGYGPILDAAAVSAPETDAARDREAEAALAASLGAIGPLDMRVDGRRIIVPHDEASFADAVAEHPDARIIAGATDVGLWITKRLYDPATVIFAGEVGELKTIAVEGDALMVGAAVTHAQFARTVEEMAPPLGEMMRRFGGLQVRSAGTVGGNIANGSPIGDLPPAMIAAGATLSIGKAGSCRSMALEDYFIDYGKQARDPGEYVRSLCVPLDGLSRLTCHKVSKRFDSDISAVLAAFALWVEDGVVQKARIAFGGMAATPRRAPRAEAALIGHRYDETAVRNAQAALAEDFTPISDMRASATYRMRVAQNLLMRDFLERTEPETRTRLAGGAVARLAGRAA